VAAAEKEVAQDPDAEPAEALPVLPLLDVDWELVPNDIICSMTPPEGARDARGQRGRRGEEVSHRSGRGAVPVSRRPGE
jgi:hypothetical protein